MTDHRPTSTYVSTQPLFVAVLEDDAELRQDILLPALRNYGFRTQGAATATELYRIMYSQRFDVVLLDMGLPDADGLSVAQHLRSRSEIGIVMLTGHTGRQHHLNALKHGADFYLTKPVDLEVLAATLHALGRRLYPQQVRDTAENFTKAERWRLEAGGWRLVSPSGKILALSAAEQCVAVTLAVENGSPVSRQMLIRALTRKIYAFDPHRLEMMIHRFRKKALQHTGEELPIVTVRGNGYLMNCDNDPSIPSSP